MSESREKALHFVGEHVKKSETNGFGLGDSVKLPLSTGGHDTGTIVDFFYREKDDESDDAVVIAKIGVLGKPNVFTEIEVVQLRQMQDALIDKDK